MSFTAARVLVVGLAWSNLYFAYYGYRNTGKFILLGTANIVSSTVSGDTHTITNLMSDAGLRYMAFLATSA